MLLPAKSGAKERFPPGWCGKGGTRIGGEPGRKKQQRSERRGLDGRVQQSRSMGLRGEASKETSRQREKKSEREGGNEREGIIVYRERGENVSGVRDAMEVWGGKQLRSESLLTEMARDPYKKHVRWHNRARRYNNACREESRQATAPSTWPLVIRIIRLRVRGYSGRRTGRGGGTGGGRAPQGSPLPPAPSALPTAPGWCGRRRARPRGPGPRGPGG